MNKILCYILATISFLYSNRLYAQISASDHCAAATAITVNTNCVAVNYSNIGATNSGNPIPSCGNTPSNDVWFSVIVPASGHLQIKIQNITSMTTSCAFYTGTCGSLSEIKCYQAFGFHNFNDITLANQTIYIRVWRYNNSTGGNFSICAWEPIPPSNDNCVDAIELNVGSTCSPSVYNNIGCTSEAPAISPNPTCGNYQGSDVWFKATIPSSGHIRIQKTSLTNINAYSTFYVGSCGSMTQIGCNTGNEAFNINNPSLAGQTLYIRIWDQNNSNSTGGTFNLCVFDPNTPVNDSCQYATLIPVGTTCTFSAYNNIGCTGDGTNVAPVPSCGIFQGGDAWYKVIVPLSGHLRIEKSNVSGISAQSAIYTGTCGSMTQLTCLVANQAFNLNNPSMGGQTLFIRVWDFNNAFGGGTFNLCAWETNPPVNDFCSNAIPITVGTSCNYSLYNNIGCTAESIGISPSPSCGFYQGGDVWFTLVVPNSGHLRIEKSNLSNINAQSAIYSGTCGAMTQIGCSVGNTAFNIHNHAMGGQTLYIRVWDFNHAYDGGTFNICAWEPNILENDFCANAVVLPVNSSCDKDTFYLTGTTSESISISPNPSCGIYTGGDLWFKFTVPNSGHLRIEKTNLNITNSQFAVYTGTCGAMTQLACPGGNNAYNLHDHNMGGQTLYLRVWDLNNAFGSGQFTLCAWEPNIPENDFCANAIPITVGFVCTPITLSSIGCTSESTSIAANPSCGFYSGGDIWYSFVMPLTGLLKIEKTSLNPMNAQLAIYSGTCGSLSQVACYQLQNSITINNPLLIGQTLLLRIWNYNNQDGGTFTLCMYDPTCLLNINSINHIPPSCSLVNDGSLTINASCTLCIGSLEYSLNNGPYQSSNVFTNLGEGAYNVKVRDSAKPLCYYDSTIFMIPTLQAFTYYQDLDGDGYGKSNVSISTCYGAPPNYVLTAGDCNDANSNIHPGALEITCNGIDENCNGLGDDTPGEINIISNCINIVDGDLIVELNNSNGTDFGNITINDSVIQYFTIENTDPYSMLVSNIYVSGTDATSYSIGSFTPNTTLPPNSTIDFSITFSPTTIGAKNAIVNITNNDCNESSYDFAIRGNGTNDIFSLLELNLFIEGYYTGSGIMASVLNNQGIEACPDLVDTILVELRNPVNFNLVASTKTILNNSGYTLCKFPNISGNYYIAIKHRNALQTWSASTISLNPMLTAYYDFTSSNTAAYGNNLVEVDQGIWAIYSGDLNQDENIDLLDAGILESDTYNFLYGYQKSDINGDGNVDLLDNPILENNINSFIFSIHP